MSSGRNVDEATVAGFGAEWSTFDQHRVSDEELHRAFERYFRIFPWERLDADAIGFDAGCGSGRWARLVAPRVGELHCVDASPETVAVARRTLADHPNCVFHEASVDELPFAAASMDFGYSLGVLHHVPNPESGLRSCVRALRPGAPLLVYLYYALDGRPAWYRWLWRASDLIRLLVSRLPHRGKLWISTVVATGVYWPLARIALLVERLHGSAERVPLAFYRRHSLYTMRTDAYDRFGTRLERRFSQGQVRQMMTAAGLRDVCFSDLPPFWCAVGLRA